jgi:hypothetical protein
MKKSPSFRGLLLYFPLLLCVAVMLPRLWSPQLGFFDDAVGLITAKGIWSGQGILHGDVNGRFRPIYWLSYAVIYRLAGNTPFWFFFGNLVLFLLITACAIRLALGFGLDSKAAWVVGITLVIAGPVLENVYTFGKPEPLQMVWILLLLLACGLYPRARAWYWKLAAVLGMASLAFLACNTKETGVLLIPATWVSWLMAWVWYRFTGRAGHPAVKQRLALACSSLAGVFSYWVLSSTILKKSLFNSRSGAFNYHFSWIVSQIHLEGFWMVRDFLYLVPIGVIALVFAIRKSNRDCLLPIIECLVWIALWLGVYLPWTYIPEYYLLPVAISAALLCGLFFSLNWKLLAEPLPGKNLAVAALILSGLLLTLTLPSQVSNGRLQLATDRANADMLAFVVQHVPQGSTVWININPPNEYVGEFTLWVTQLENRPDLRVDYFHSQSLAEAQLRGGAVWIVSPYMENLFYPSVRVGMTELPTRQWNEALDQYMAGHGSLIRLIRQSFTSSNLDPLRFFCPLARSLSYCKVPDAPLDHRVFAYGWKIYSLP